MKLVYSINAASVICHGEKQLKKIEDSLKVMYRNDVNVVFLIRKDDEIRIGMLREEVLGHYQTIMDSLQKSNDDIIDYQENVDSYIENAAAYYGDCNYVSWKFHIHGKPVMIQNVDA